MDLLLDFGDNPIYPFWDAHEQINLNFFGGYSINYLDICPFLGHTGKVLKAPIVQHNAGSEFMNDWNWKKKDAILEKILLALTREIGDDPCFLCLNFPG